MLTLHLGYLASDYVVLSPVEEIGISGYTPGQLYEQYLQRINYDYRANYQYSSWGYDSIWAVALTLNKTVNTLKETGE